MGVLLLLRVSGIAQKRVNKLIDVEWSRAVNAVEMEIMHLSLSKAGRRNLITEQKALSSIPQFLSKLHAVQSIFSTILAIAVTAIPVYNQGKMFVFVPLLVQVGFWAIKNVILAIGTSTSDWQTDASYQYNSDLIRRMYYGIRDIKCFGWEPAFIKPQNYKQKCGYSFGLAVIACINTALSTVEYLLDKVSGCIIMHYYFSVSSSTTTADLYQLTTLVNDVHSKNMEIYGCLDDVRQLVRLNKNIKQYLKGDFIESLTQLPVPKETAEIVMNKCSFKWAASSETPDIKHISLSASGNEIVAVKGKTGSGKSSLLMAVCGELEMTNGSGHVSGEIAYMEHPAWILNDTMQANILLGREYIKEHYESVLFACAFEDDLASWPSGDKTVIAEHGTNISGGQRARLALARALYSQADIYVLDDPLSAVDAHVRRHILEHALLDTGLLKGKLRVISSNTDCILPFASQVVCLDNGVAHVSQQAPKIYYPVLLPPVYENISKAIAGQMVELSDSDTSTISGSEHMPATILAKESAKFVYEKLMFIIRICGWPAVISTVVIGLVEPAVTFKLDGYILDLFKTAQSEDGGNTKVLMQFFLSSIASNIASSTLNAVTRYLDSNVFAKLVEHKIKQAFISGIIHAPLQYFEETSEHEITEAYCEGADKVSLQIVRLLRNRPAALATIVLSLYRSGMLSPYVIMVVIPSMFFELRWLPQWTALKSNLKTLFGKALLNARKVSQTIKSNKQLIRIYGAEKYFMHNFALVKDSELHIKYIIEDVLSLISDCGVAIGHAEKVLFLAVVAVQAIFWGISVSSGEYLQLDIMRERVGSNIMSLIGVQAMIYEIAQSAATLYEFTSIKPEAPYVVETARPKQNWPHSGQIEFCDFSLKYGESLEPALKNLNLIITPGEKIGIVGRTGAGKSSFAKALFRLVPAGTSGSIKIDGQDIGEIGVGDLRPQLGIIPQESTLYNGSMRDNLDPLGNYSMEELWAALIKCNAAEIAASLANESDGLYDSIYGYELEADHLIQWRKSSWIKRAFQTIVGNKPLASQSFLDQPTGALDKVVRNINSKLSCGQKQLISMCRLVMRKSKVIVLDEATAEVDLETDKKIHNAIKKEFSDCTILTIAHRLETVMHSDRVIVMDKGEVVEIGPPKELLKQNGHFAKLVSANNFGQYADHGLLA